MAFMALIGVIYNIYSNAMSNLKRSLKTTITTYIEVRCNSHPNYLARLLGGTWITSRTLMWRAMR